MKEWNEMSEKERYIDLYGEEGEQKYNRKQKAWSIMEEAKDLVERRWKEEFPEDDLQKQEKPYGYYWFNSTPNY